MQKDFCIELQFSSLKFNIEIISKIDLITTRVAKRAKVMFLQVCVTHSVQQGEGRCATPKVSEQHHLGPGDNTPLSLGPGDNTSLPPGTRWQHLPPPWVQVTTPPPPPPARDYTQAGGMYPTGMHSCFIFKQCQLLLLKELQGYTCIHTYNLYG